MLASTAADSIAITRDAGLLSRVRFFFPGENQGRRPPAAFESRSEFAEQDSKPGTVLPYNACTILEHQIAPVLAVSIATK